MCVCVCVSDKLLSRKGLLNTTDSLFFMIFKRRRLSLLTILGISGSRRRRKNPLLTQALSTISIVILGASVKLFVVCKFASLYLFDMAFFFITNYRWGWSKQKEPTPSMI